MTRYRHTQYGVLILTVLGIGLVICTALMLGATGPAGRLIFALAAALLLLCLILFGSLTVTVDADEVVAAFGPGLITKRFAVREIRRVSTVRNNWVYGWGIRMTPHGWLYNVSGLDAVELEMRNNRKIRIGTDDPKSLQAALEQVITPKT